MRVTNTGTSALSAWSLGFSFANGQKVTQGWSADWSQLGTTVTAKNAAWNGTLAVGQTVDIGFNGSHTGTNNAPTAFTVNGAPFLTNAWIQWHDARGSSTEGPRSSFRDLPIRQNLRRTVSSTHRLRVIATSVAATAALAAPLVSEPSPPTPPVTGDWLHAGGNRIVDEAGNQVWLTGANWFGFNASETGLPRPVVGQHHPDHQGHGRPRHQHGPGADLHPAAAGVEGRPGDRAQRQHLRQPGAGRHEQPADLRLLAAAVRAVRHQGHDRRAQREADNSGHIHPVWWKGTITVEQFYQAWEWVTTRYRTTTPIVAMDIKNEPHGTPNQPPRAKWDNTTDQDNFKNACQTAGKRILAINPNVLILCEGIEVYPREGSNWTRPTADAELLLQLVGRQPARGPRLPDQPGRQPGPAGLLAARLRPLVFNQPWFQKPSTRRR